MSSSGEGEKRTMRVKILSHIVGSPSFAAGEVVELEERIAKAWIADGIAVASRDEKPVERAVRA
jgi:hypothetical protein